MKRLALNEDDIEDAVFTWCLTKVVLKIIGSKFSNRNDIEEVDLE